jgi:hypothetical protein
METRILETKASHVFSFDKSVRSVVLLNSDGKVIAEFGRPGLIPLEPKSETKTIYMKAAMALAMTTPMDKYHGRIRTAVLVKEKLTMICFNLVGRILLVLTDPEFQLQKAEELGRMIDQLGID